MGNTAVAEVLTGTEDLDELFKLSASETEPEDDEDDEDDEEEEDDEDDEDIGPEEMPEP